MQVDAVRALGGEVRLVGDSYTETQSYAWQAAEEERRSFIAPYDDPLTIAGQGTVGTEILKQLGSRVEDLHAVFVPIGGGGLIAGIAAYIKALRPDVSIIGVEPSGANCMALSLREGRRVTLSKVDAFADGVAVKSVGMVLPLLS
jgi:threonine dehydratase